MKALSWLMGWRLLRRELRAGELTVLLLALLVAVSAMSSVAFFSARIEQALSRQASQLLAADLVVNGNTPAQPVWQQQAQTGRLQQATVTTFPSMVFAREQAVLTSLKAVSDTYPLRGEVRIQRDGKTSEGRLRPASGEVWADGRLLQKLGLKPGDMLRLGSLNLKVTAEVLREPDGAVDIYNFIPRLMLNEADLPATGLIQPGSRARYRFLVAGDAANVKAYREWLAPQLDKRTRLEDVEEARPEVKSALERARRFLGLTAMLSVLLSAAAVALAVRRYLSRHWQSVAVLRALGQTGGEVATVWGSLFLWLGLLAGVAGTLIGYGVHELLLYLARQWLGDALPIPGWQAWLGGPLSALILLAGFAWPPLLALRRIPAMAVLRADMPASRGSLLVPLLAVLALLGLAAWQIGDSVLAVWLLAGLGGFLVAVALVAALVVWLLGKLPLATAVGWRHGAANLARRPWLAVIQIAALSVSLMALLTLTVVRDDLIGAWQRSVPADAPDSFLINLQQDQRTTLKAQFASAGVNAPEAAPMIRARLLLINQKPVNPADYEDERAQRLSEREFNLSWRDAAPPGNGIVAGSWWQPGSKVPAFSVEEGLAQTLGIKLGDTLVFDIAGTQWQAPVTSLRKVSWDSFQPNFFVIAPSGWMGNQAASYITSYRAADKSFNNRVVAALPNVTVIDISVIVTEVKAVIDRLALAIEAMFALALAAGVLVLWAALAATRDERLFDVALLRALGASRAQVRSVVVAELAWLGALTGLLAGVGAMLIGALVALKLFNLPLTVNGWLPLLGMLGGALVVGLAGWPLLRKVMNTPPADVLRQANTP